MIYPLIYADHSLATWPMATGATIAALCRHAKREAGPRRFAALPGRCIMPHTAHLTAYTLPKGLQ